MLERAEKLHRQFFEPARGAARGARWEPPVDIMESATHFWVVAALPGVPSDRIEVAFDANILIIAGHRPRPSVMHNAAIHRLEIPYGRFERRIGLSGPGLSLAGTEVRDGCLIVTLSKDG